MVLSTRILVVSLLFLLLGAASARPQAPDVSELLEQPVNTDRPLPDSEWFIQQVRARLKTDEELLRQYTYRERRRDIKVSKLGKVSLGPQREFEVYPSPVSGETYKRLVAVNGKPLDAAALAEQDQEHRDDLLERQEKLKRETPDEREERLEKQAEERREEQERLEDGFRVFDIQLIGRDTIDDRQMIVAKLTPRPDADPRTRIGKAMKKMRGRAWVNEQDFEIAQVAVEVIEDVKIGWGIIGRLHAGSEVMFQRTKVNDEIWLPSLIHVKMSGRTFIFRKFDLHTTTEYSDYRKFSVETSVHVSKPPAQDDHP